VTLPSGVVARTRSGMDVVTVPMAGRSSGQACLYVRSGSRYEPDDAGGVSHFVEHMLFRGSREDPDGKRTTRELERVGGTLDAGTTRDHVYYSTPFPMGEWRTAVRALGRLVCEPLFEPAAVELERSVILEELLDEYDGDGRDVSLENLSKRAVFGAHPLASPIAGTPASVRSMTAAHLREHHDRHYTPRNLVLCVAGPVSPDELLPFVETVFEALPSVDAGPVTASTAPATYFGGLVHVEHEASLTQLRLCFPALIDGHPDHAAQQALLHALDDGFGSRLPARLIEQQGLLYRVRADLDDYADTALLELDAGCSPEKVGDAVDALRRLLEELREGGIDADELERSRSRWRAYIRYGVDSPATLAAWLGGTRIFRSPPSLEERLCALDDVSTDAVRRVAARMFTVAPSVAVVGRVTADARRRLEALVRGA